MRSRLIGTSSAMILEVIWMQINWLMRRTKIRILGLKSILFLVEDSND